MVTMDTMSHLLKIVVLFILLTISDGKDSYHEASQGRIQKVTCSQICDEVKIDDGCRFAPLDRPREEVIVITNGSSTLQSWRWETITMVVSSYQGIRQTGLTACLTHSKGKRFGLRERVPGSENLSEVLGNITSVKTNFVRMITGNQELLMADHIVLDLLPFFQQLDKADDEDKLNAIANLTDILFTLTAKVIEQRKKLDPHAKGSHFDASYEPVYCIVPWEPPCLENDCSPLRSLLSHCWVLVMSPDSYEPKPLPSTNICTAQATVPLAKFIYGVDRYIALRAGPFSEGSIVAGIPWHGFTYNCNAGLSNDTCKVKAAEDGKCFDRSNRQRQSLSHIHGLSFPNVDVKMDIINKGVYINVNESAQLWFENFTTLYIKYKLVQDLQLRGLSIWYGEDMEIEMTGESGMFSILSWNFLTQQVLHKSVFSPSLSHHVYADTVAGIAVGCLILGTVLGVTFTCIAFRKRNFQGWNRPFNLDEEEDANFRDDEGL